MRDLIAIAQNTFGRIARQKAVYFVLMSSVVIVGAMGLYGTLSAGRAQIMMLDGALAMCLIVGLVTAMAAALEIPRELKEQTAHLILSKPVGRAQVVIGKLRGISGLCIMNVALVAVASALVIHSNYGTVAPGYFAACALVAAEAVVLAAAGILLSLFMNDVLALVGVFVVFAVGHAVHVLPRVMAEGGGHKLAVAVSNVLPNFQHLDFKGLVGNGVAIGGAVLVPGLLYALCYATALTAVAVAVFQSRDIH